MKYAKKRPLPLPSPTAKRAMNFSEPPKHAGKFAIITQMHTTRGKQFMMGDLVRISFNQRYIPDTGSIQIISVADTVPTNRTFMGGQYTIPKKKIEYIDKIPKETTCKLMSKEYDIPVLTRLKVKSHNPTQGIITVDYNNEPIIIRDIHIEGVPSDEPSLDEMPPEAYQTYIPHSTTFGSAPPPYYFHGTDDA